MRSLPVRVLIVLCVVLLPACGPRLSAPPAPTPRQAETGDALDHLLTLMAQRLLVMHDVARWKWNAKRPIADPERERAFLEAMVARSDLEPEFTRAFFGAQIEAAKIIQRQDFQRWEAGGGGPFAGVPDLASELRPKIDLLSGAMLKALSRARPFFRDKERMEEVRRRAREMLSREGITDEVCDRAIEPLLMP